MNVLNKCLSGEGSLSPSERLTTFGGNLYWALVDTSTLRPSHFITANERIHFSEIIQSHNIKVSEMKHVRQWVKFTRK